MAALTNLVPLSTHSFQELNTVVVSWKKRLSFWQKEANFLLDLVNFNFIPEKYPISYAKAKYDLNNLVQDDLCHLLESVDHLSKELTLVDEPSRRALAVKEENYTQLGKQIALTEQKYNELKIYILEVIANSFPLHIF
ncbi:MAG: hypothetical protein R2828_31995 [Saprospiraceae bacterium]